MRGGSALRFWAVDAFWARLQALCTPVGLEFPEKN
jgi:hypothetical protein